MSVGPSPIPPIDQSLLPAEVRGGSEKDKQTYVAALGFERMLLGELTKAMTATAQPVGDDSSGDGSDSSASIDSTGGDSSGGDAASSAYLSMLPDQLADSLTSGGGLGLAQSIYDSMKERSA